MKKVLIIIGIILGLLLLIWLVLEPVAEHYVNKQLNKMEDYEGQVKDVDINLFRGAYSLDSVYIDHKDSNEKHPFFTADEIDFSVEWQALFNGRIVGEIIFRQPELYFKVVKDSVQKPEAKPISSVLDGLMPIEINRLEVIQAKVHYLDMSRTPKVDIVASDAHILAKNLSNIKNQSEALPASITASANTSGNGQFSAAVGLDLLKSPMEYDLSAELRDVNLTEINEFAKAYAGFTFEAGQMYIGLEVVSKSGEYEGFVKPVLENVEIVNLNSERQSFWRKAWEVALGATAELFENQSKERIATKVPFSGTQSQSSTSVWTTIVNVLENAFIEAFNKNLSEDLDLQEATQNSSKKEEEDEEFLGIF